MNSNQITPFSPEMPWYLQTPPSSRVKFNLTGNLYYEDNTIPKEDSPKFNEVTSEEKDESSNDYLNKIKQEYSMKNKLNFIRNNLTKITEEICSQSEKKNFLSEILTPWLINFPSINFSKAILDGLLAINAPIPLQIETVKVLFKYQRATLQRYFEILNNEFYAIRALIFNKYDELRLQYAKKNEDLLKIFSKTRINSQAEDFLITHTEQAERQLAERDLFQTRAILGDYTKDSFAIRLFTFHLGRNHVKEVKKELEKEPAATKASELIDSVMNACPNRDLTGSLNRRLNFLTAELLAAKEDRQSKAYCERRNLTYKR